MDKIFLKEHIKNGRGHPLKNLNGMPAFGFPENVFITRCLLDSYSSCSRFSSCFASSSPTHGHWVYLVSHNTTWNLHSLKKMSILMENHAMCIPMQSSPRMCIWSVNVNHSPRCIISDMPEVCAFVSGWELFLLTDQDVIFLLNLQEVSCRDLWIEMFSS